MPKDPKEDKALAKIQEKIEGDVTRREEAKRRGEAARRRTIERQKQGQPKGRREK